MRARRSLRGRATVLLPLKAHGVGVQLSGLGSTASRSEDLQ